MSNLEVRTDAPLCVIDLNADLGEGCQNDRELLHLVSSASICCGAHAGDPGSIRETLQWAAERGVVVGAHPGFADREGFGRRAQVITTGDVEKLICEQVEMLKALACGVGLPVRFLKPHGALYNQSQAQEPVAQGVLLAAVRLDLTLLGQPGTLLERLRASKVSGTFPRASPIVAIARSSSWLPAVSQGRFSTTRMRSDTRFSAWSRRDG